MAELKLLLIEFPEEQHSETMQRLEQTLHQLLNERQGPVHVELPSGDSPAWQFRGVHAFFKMSLDTATCPVHAREAPFSPAVFGLMPKCQPRSQCSAEALSVCAFPRLVEAAGCSCMYFWGRAFDKHTAPQRAHQPNAPVLVESQTRMQSTCSRQQSRLRRCTSHQWLLQRSPPTTPPAHSHPSQPLTPPATDLTAPRSPAHRQ